MKQVNSKYPFVAFADTRQGGRSENQDTCAWADTPHGLLVTVCDGMGGGPAGKLASTIAAENIVNYVSRENDEPDKCELIRQAVLNANKAILEYTERDPSKKGMGTTVTVLLLNDNSAVVAHVGDSRIYQFRHGRKQYRTYDHSLVFEKLQQGFYKTEEEARLSGESNIIMRVLGRKEGLLVDVKELPYEKSDRFLLCSDGIWGMFPEKDLVKMAAGTKELSGAMESMIVGADSLGIKAGSHHDNLTAVIIETTKDSILKETMSTKQKRIVFALAAVCIVSIILNVILILIMPKDKKVGYVEEDKPEQVDTLTDNQNN